MVWVVAGGALLWYIAVCLFYPAADAVLILYALCVVRYWLTHPDRGEPGPPDNLPDVIVTEDGKLYEKEGGGPPKAGEGR